MNPETPTIRVAIVEDRAEDRDRFEQLLKDANDLLCVAVCASAENALEVLPRAKPDIVLMDIQLPGLSGTDCVPRLRAALPDTQFMMLTVFEDHDRIFQALAAGATGYLLKKTPDAKILEAIHELHAGGAPMSGQIARQVVAAFQGPPSSTPTLSQLSRVEVVVLRFLARGLLYKEVADQLGITVSTVRTHVWHIYRKLHVHNRTEAVLKGLSRPSF